jgi:hypothetical protein
MRALPEARGAARRARAGRLPAGVQLHATTPTLATRAATTTCTPWPRSTTPAQPCSKPGGFLVVVTKDLRENGGLRDLSGTTIALCHAVGLQYWQRVIPLLAAIRDSELLPRPSFWQLTQIRKAVARGERTALVCHEDVLVFRKPIVKGAKTSFQPRIGVLTPFT